MTDTKHTTSGSNEVVEFKVFWYSTGFSIECRRVNTHYSGLPVRVLKNLHLIEYTIKNYGNFRESDE